MTKKFVPLNDNPEQNPDTKYIGGEYSTFDADFSNKVKELRKSYKTLDDIKNDAVNGTQNNKAKKELRDFIEKKQRAFKNAAQQLAANKMLQQEKAIKLYLVKTRKDIMSTILNNEMLLSYALRFSDLHIWEKEAFLKLLNKKLSDFYGIEWGDDAVLNTYGETGNAAYTPASRIHGSCIRIDGNPETLDEFIKLFAHEFSHKLVSEKPNATPFGAQAAAVTHEFYVNSKEDAHDYMFNADELLSYTIEQSIATNFESDLRLLSMSMVKSHDIKK